MHADNHIAIIGGTFNPVHFGHLRLAEEVRESLELDRVVFIPTNLPPHKPDNWVVEPYLRAEMLSLATSSNPSLEVSDIELERGGTSYTIDTVRQLTEGDGLIVTLVVGADSFNDITTWCEYERLLELADICVIPRPGFPVKKPGEVLPVELANKFCYDTAEEVYMSSMGHRVIYLQTTLLEISSSDIRKRVRNQMSIKYLLPAEVEDFILSKGLYR